MVIKGTPGGSYGGIGITRATGPIGVSGIANVSEVNSVET